MAAVYGNGYVSTVTVEARWTQMAQAADASQAAYFRGTLADERQAVATDLAGARDRLDDLPVLAGKVARLENDLRELNRLIGALDRRFAAMWSVER